MFRISLNDIDHRGRGSSGIELCWMWRFHPLEQRIFMVHASAIYIKCTIDVLSYSLSLEDLHNRCVVSFPKHHNRPLISDSTHQPLVVLGIPDLL